MAAKKTTTTTREDSYVAIERLQRRTATYYLLGIEPLLMNRMAKKAKEELLMPRRSLNKAARAATLKHQPPEEFRDSVYMCRDEDAPTAIHVPSNALKKAMAQAAIDMEGATKAEVGRLIKITDATVFLYGTPKLHMSVVRLAGFTKTPDIRTRAIFPTWCCKITVQMISTKIRENDVTNLLDGAGDIVGIGDGRTEKGTFNFGSWVLVQPDDKRWHEITRTQGRKVQLAALAKPEAYDADSEELLAWYDSEIVRREIDRTPPKVKPPTGGGAGGNGKHQPQAGAA